MAGKSSKIKELENYLISKESDVDVAAAHQAILVTGKEIAKYEAEISMLQEKLAEEATKQAEMRGEIEILIAQCKESHAQLKAKDAQIKKQSVALQQFETILQEKDAEIQNREQYLVKMTKQLDDKKEQLHLANLKIRQINKSAFVELNSKLEEKDKEVKMLKGMVKGHHLELEAKNKDMARLKKEVRKLKKTNQMKKEFIQTFVNTNDEDQIKQLKKMEEIELQDAIEETKREDYSDNDTSGGGKHRKGSDLSNNSVISSTKSRSGKRPHKKTGDIKLPAISQTEDAEVKKKKTPVGSKARYSERYLQKVESYNHMIADSVFHNNSVNMQGILSHHYNALPNDLTMPKRDHSPSQSSDVLTPMRPRKKEFDINVDVNEIIRKSLVGKAANYPHVGRVKVGNIKSGNIQRVKIRKNSKA